MATPSLDKKITQLPIVLSAPDDAWIVVVVEKADGVSVTSRIKKSNLLS